MTGACFVRAKSARDAPPVALLNTNSLAEPFAPRPDWHYRPEFFDGLVGLGPLPDALREPENAPADLDDPGLDAAASLLRDILPYRYWEFTRTVAVVHPVTHRRIEPLSLSSNSGSATIDPPGIFLTVTHPAPTAEAFVHEMAHQKLMAQGITVERAGPFLEPSDLEVYSAAVDRPRPLPAILHAAFSFLHMIELDLALLQAERFPAEARSLLPGNMRVALSTVDQLQRHARPGPAGEDFLACLYRWAEDLFARGRSL